MRDDLRDRIESGEQDSAGQRTILTLRSYADGHAMEMIDGIYEVVGPSRPLENNPRQFATTIRRKQ
jgi:hypothetical protein